MATNWRMPVLDTDPDDAFINLVGNVESCHVEDEEVDDLLISVGDPKSGVMTSGSRRITLGPSNKDDYKAWIPNDVSDSSLLEQASLKDILPKGFTLSLDDVMKISHDLMSILASLHAESIVYGDVQVGNIFINEHLKAFLIKSDKSKKQNNEAAFHDESIADVKAMCKVMGSLCSFDVKKPPPDSQNSIKKAETAYFNLLRRGYGDGITAKDFLEVLRRIIVDGSSDLEDETNDEVDDDQAKRPETVLPPISIKNPTAPSSKTGKCKDVDKKRSKVKSLDASKAEKARQILEYVANDAGGLVQRCEDRKDAERSVETSVQEVDVGGKGGEPNQLSPQSSGESKLRNEDLLAMAYQCYLKLTVLEWEEHKHGRVLLMAQLAIKCHNASRSIHGGEGNVYDILMMCGDSHLLLALDPSKQHLNHEDYLNISKIDKFFRETAFIQQTSQEYDWATEFQTETKDCLEWSIKCYKACLGDEVKLEKAFKTSVGQKLGNAFNELGVFLMNTAVKELMPSAFEELWKESYHCLDTGVKSFEKVSDSTNVALLTCNMGRLMRLCAQRGSMGPDAEFSPNEKHYYMKAAECYEKGLRILGNKSSHVEIWDSITWELCSTYFNMACLMQDQPPVSTSNLAEIEKDVLKFMNKARALCDTNETSSRQPLYQNRAVTIQLRLASMVHNSITNQKYTNYLAKLHYTKAVQLFTEMNSPGEQLTEELGRVALLLEHQVETGEQEEALQHEAPRQAQKRGKVRGLGHMTTLACCFLGAIGPQPEPRAVGTHAPASRPGAVDNYMGQEPAASTHRTLMAEFEMERFQSE